MLRRLFSSPHLKIKTLRTALSPSNPRFAAPLLTRHVTAQPGTFSLSPLRSTLLISIQFNFAFSSCYPNQLDASFKKRVEDIVPIATGHEREEIQADLEGRDILEINHPEGPFGTKEAPAVVKSYFDRRIVGCPGGEGEDEHDVVWFWLEKGKSFECPVCSQYFELEVVGPGGDPYGHGDHH
uniref:Uncharacterized protein n=1 Tax=Cajanus cajan TaxID=3821 RepID=A0A151SXR2_CAJCA|nr:hypothetical protein KK1_015024 [Cajanus cajan]